LEMDIRNDLYTLRTIRREEALKRRVSSSRKAINYQISIV